MDLRIKQGFRLFSSIQPYFWEGKTAYYSYEGQTINLQTRGEMDSTGYPARRHGKQGRASRYSSDYAWCS